MQLEIERSGLEKKFIEAFVPVIAQQGLALYDLEYIKGSSTLRIFIMNPESETAVIEECVQVDKALSPIFEDADWIPEDIVLEVSSPGMFRAIRTQEHLGMALEKWVLVKLSGKVEESMLSEPLKGILGKNKLRGVLSSFNNEKITLQTQGVQVELPLLMIKKITLDPDV